MCTQKTAVLLRDYNILLSMSSFLSNTGNVLEREGKVRLKKEGREGSIGRRVTTMEEGREGRRDKRKERDLQRF